MIGLSANRASPTTEMYFYLHYPNTVTTSYVWPTERLKCSDFYTLAVGHREISLKLTGILLPLVSFPSAGQGYTGCWRSNDITVVIQCWTLHATVPTCQAKVVHGCNNGMTVMG